MELHWSRVLSKKCNISYWFPNHLLHIDHGSNRFLYIYTIKMRKSPLWKNWEWNARLIYTINYYNKNNNNKNQNRITKAFERFLVSKTIYIYCIAKMVLLCTLNYIASFSFFWFEQSINTFKSSASAFYCYQICKKKVREFKILAILYFCCVFIIFILTLQQVLLAIVLNKVRNFVHICPVALFHLHLTLYNKNSLWIKSIRPSSFALSILYFSQGNFTNWKHSITIFSYIVKKQ